MKSYKKLCLLIIFLLIISCMFISCQSASSKVTVSFMVDGELYKEYILNYGEGIEDVPQTPPKPLYLAQWNIDDFSEFYTDTTITAVYTKNFFTAVFRVEDDDKILTLRTTDIEFGENPSSFPPIPEKEGYTAEWEITDFTEIRTDVVVYAIYTPIIKKITFEDEEGNILYIRETPYGQALEDIPEVPLVEGYTGYWSVQDFSNIIENMTVKAVYTDRILTVDLVDSDDQTPSQMNFAYGQRLDLPVQQYRFGYIFGGWFEDSEFDNPISIDNIYDDLTVYAYWIEINDHIAEDKNKFEFTLNEDQRGYAIRPKEDAELSSNIVLPNSHEGLLVIEIEDRAFEGMDLTSILIPVGVTRIGERAFYGCQNLETVQFADKNRLQTISKEAFYQNISLIQISISKDIQEIGEKAFYGCLALSSFNIPEGANLTTIGSGAFQNSHNIRRINISKEIMEIGDYAFSNLSVTELNFEGLENLLIIGAFAFENCDWIIEFNAPNIINIGQGAFAGCRSLTELTINGDIPIVDYFGENAFPNSYEVTQLSRLRDVQGEFVKNAQGEYVYQNITRRLPVNLATINFRDGITNIANNVLQNCVAVHNIRIPSSVVKIGEYAFAIPSDSHGLMAKGELYIPSNSNLEEIGFRAFLHRSSVTEIYLPATIKRIEAEAFRNADNLSKIVFSPDSNIDYIGSKAFDSTEWINFQPDGIISIGNIALSFKNAGKYGEINLALPNGIKAVAPDAFNGISQIVRVDIPSSIKAIYDNAFYNCNRLTVVNMEEGIEYIGNNVFSGCDALKEITIPKSVENIGESILKDCTSLEKMIIYGDRILGHFFGLDSFDNSYLAYQTDEQALDYEIEEEEERVYLKWAPLADLYDVYPINYTIYVKNVLNKNEEAVDILRLGSITHSFSSPYYDEDEEKYSLYFNLEELLSGIRAVSEIGEFILPQGRNWDNIFEIKAFYANDYYIPNSLKEIVFKEDNFPVDRKVAPYSFMNIKSLKKIVLADGIQEIGQWAFYNCESLGVVDDQVIPLGIPSTLTKIGDYAFYNNSCLGELSFGVNVNLEQIGIYAFQNSGLRTLYIPRSVREIGEGAFMDNDLMQSVSFQDAFVQTSQGEVVNYLHIGDKAFLGCEEIRNVEFPDRLTVIGAKALAYNIKLYNISFRQTSYIQTIGEKAFAYCNMLNSIVLPPSINLDETLTILKANGALSEITLYNDKINDYHNITLGMLFGEEAYEGSYAAEQRGTVYHIPQTLTKINFLGGKLSENFFENASAIMIATLENVTEIGEKAFYNCSGLENIDIPDTVKSIGSNAFANCISLVYTEISSLSELEYLGERAFENNQNLVEIYLPQGVGEIGEYAFANNYSLEEIHISNVQTINDYAFYECSNIKKIILSSDIEYIGNYAFYNCFLADIVYDKFDNLKHIGNYAFYNCLGLRILHAESIETIGVNAFSQAHNLEEITITGKNTLGTLFGSGYFENSYRVDQNGTYYIPSSLKRVRISSTAESLTALLFKDCEGISDIIFMSAQAPALSQGVFENIENMIKIFAPFEYLESYRQAYDEYPNIYPQPTNYENFEFIEVGGGYSIKAAANAEFEDVLYIPAFYNGIQVIKIAPKAFYGLTAIEELIVPATIKEIGSSAFENCLELKVVTFEGGSNLIKIGDNAFNKCKSLREITLPQKLDTIGAYAFAGDRSVENALRKVIFDAQSSLIEIGAYAFSFNPNLLSISLPTSLEKLGKAAFRESGLQEVSFGQGGLSEIEDEVFYGCTLTAVSIPDSVSVIGKNAFAECIYLENVFLGEGVKDIQERAFYNNVSLTDILLPYSLEKIGKQAFKYSQSLTTISIPQNVWYIGEQSFMGCLSLYDVIFESEQISYVGSMAFYDTIWFNEQQKTAQGVVYIDNIAYSFVGDMPSMLTLKEGTIAIAPAAFENQPNLEKVILPSTLRVVGERAFYNSINLEEIDLPENSELTEIGAYAFYRAALIEFELPKTVKHIGEGAFKAIEQLADFRIHAESELATIGKEAFSELNLDIDLVLPNALESIGQRAFYNTPVKIIIGGDSQLSDIGSEAFSFTRAVDITIPQSLRTLNDAFSNIETDEILIPAWVRTIDSQAFMSSQIQKITIVGSALIDIKDMAFYGLRDTIFDISELPSLKSLGKEAFYDCKELKKFWALSVTDIGENAFYGCENIEELSTNGMDIITLFGEIPQNLFRLRISSGAVEVKENAYQGVESLTEVIFSPTVSIIKENAFKDASNLITIVLEMRESLKFVGANAFEGTQWFEQAPQGVLYIGRIAYGYKSNTKGSVNIELGTYAIADYAFYQSNITALTIPASVVRIGEMAVAECVDLETVNIAGGSQLKEIGKRAFYNNTNLLSINLPFCLEEIQEEILKGCDSLETLEYSGCFLLSQLFGDSNINITNLRIANNSEYIVDSALEGIASIQSVTIPASVRTIGEKAFSGCESLSSLNIQRGSLIHTIGDFAFENCVSLSSIALPLSAVNLGKGILAGCSAINHIALNGGVPLYSLFGNTDFDNSYTVTIDSKDYYLPKSLKNITIVEGSQKIVKHSFNSSKIKNIIMPYDITVIEEYAFYKNGELDSIVIPQTNELERIEAYAFYECMSIVSFTIYENVSYIGDRAFYNCSLLENVVILSSFFEAGFEAFKETPYEDSQSGEIYIGKVLAGFKGEMDEEYILTVAPDTTAIAAYAFENQHNLKKVVLPEGVNSIGKGAFKNCENLEEINIQDTLLKRIEDESFYGCISLNEIVIGQAIEYIGESAFRECHALSLILDGGSLKEIGGYAFSMSNISSVHIPAGVKRIGSYAFEGADLEEVKFLSQNSLEYIGEGAFYGLNSTSFDMAVLNELLEVGDFAFYSCHGLLEFVAPNIQSYGEDVFYDCKNLEKTTLVDKELFLMFGSVLDAEYYDIIELNGEYYSVPKSLTFVYISNACESVTEYAFYNCKSLKVVDLGSSVTKIGDYAFYQCLGLERVVINEGLEQIGDYAFYACEKLISSHEAQEIQKFVLPLSITTIGEYAFYNCASIENISLEENSRLRYIGERAFANLENTIFELALIRSLIIGDYAFENCALLEEVKVQSIQEMGYGVFSGCQSLKYASLSSDKYAGEFFGDTYYEESYSVNYQDTDYFIPLSLEVIDISNTMTAIVPYAFKGFYAVKTYLLSNISTIGEYAFSGNTSLESLVMPSSVVRVEDFAFEECDNLIEIEYELEDNLIYIGEQAFHDTAWYADKTAGIDNQTIYIGRVAYSHIGTIQGSLELNENTMGISPKAFMGQNLITSLYLPVSIAEIGEKAFYDCSSISSIYTSGYYTIGSLFGEEYFDLSVPAVQGGKTYYIPQSLNTITVIEPSAKIVDFAFADMASLKTVNIAASVKSFGSDILYGSSGIESLSLSGDIVLGNLFGEKFYANSYPAIQNNTTYYIPQGLSYIEILGSKIVDFAYMNLDSLTYASISSGVASIGRYAFSGCVNLANIALHSGITSIDDYAFQNCQAFTEIVLPSFAKLGNGILNGCSSLRSLSVTGNKPIHSLFGTASYPQSYQIDHNYKKYYIPVTLNRVIIKDTQKIADHLLYGLNSISEVTFTQDITEIGGYAFYGLQTLQTLRIPSTLTYIGEYAFYNNVSAEFDFILNNIKSVGEFAFSNCTKLIDFNSSQIKYIGDNAFVGCYNLSSLGITKDKPAGKLFGKKMFVASYQAEQGGEVYYIPSALKNITIYGQGALAENILANMASLEKVSLIGELEIPSTAFQGLVNVMEFEGEDIVYIGIDALNDMPWLGAFLNSQPDKTMVYIGNVAYAYKGQMDIGYRARFNEGTTQLYYYAFRNQNRLAGVEINKSMLYIAPNAFEGCTALEYFIIDDENDNFRFENGTLYDKDGEVIFSL